MELTKIFIAFVAVRIVYTALCHFLILRHHLSIYFVSIKHLVFADFVLYPCLFVHVFKSSIKQFCLNVSMTPHKAMLFLIKELKTEKFGITRMALKVDRMTRFGFG